MERPYEEAIQTVSLVAATDLSDKDRHYVFIDGDGKAALSTATSGRVGVIRAGAQAGSPVTVITDGVAIVAASGAIATGDHIASSATGQAAVGADTDSDVALTSADAAGQLISVLLKATS